MTVVDIQHFPMAAENYDNVHFTMVGIQYYAVTTEEVDFYMTVGDFRICLRSQIDDVYKTMVDIPNCS